MRFARRQDTTEIGKFNPQLVALTAVNPSSEHIPVTRVNGITTVATMPEGQFIAGQVSLMHLDGWTTDEMGIKPRAGLAPADARDPVGRAAGSLPMEDPAAVGVAAQQLSPKRKRNFDKEMAELNDFFESARRYKQAKGRQSRPISSRI